MRLLRGARGEGHGRWLGETRALDHRRVGDARAVDRRRVARGCPRGAVPVVQRVELDADAGHGRQQPARIVPRKSMTERHSTAASRISGAARGPFAAAAEERALRPDLLLHLRRARGRSDDARTRGSRASRVRHPARSVELLNRSRRGRIFGPASRERPPPVFFFEKRVTTRPKFGRVAPVRIRPRRRRASARARAAGRGGWRDDRVLSVLGASGGAESPRRGTDGKFRNGRVSSVSDQHPLIDRVEGIVTERPYFLWTTIAKSRSRLFNRTEVSWSRTRRPPPRPPGLRRRRRRRRSRPR